MTRDQNDIEPCVVANIDRYAVGRESNGQCVLTRQSHNELEPVADNQNEDGLVQSTYNIENSNDVIIGPVTHFHCPVTIIQKAETATCKDSGEISEFEKCEKPKAKPKDVSKAFKYFEKVNFKIRRKTLRILLPASIVITFILVGLITVLIITIQKSSGNQEDELGGLISLKDDVLMIPRMFWGARPPLSTRILEHPVKYVIIAHTGGATCHTLDECNAILQTLQSIAVDEGSPDIGYNFLIGSDGNIYIGRDWDSINYLQPHTISIAFIGNFSYDDFTKKMQTALRQLIRIGVQSLKLDPDYVLLSHSQTYATLSPGQKIRKVIETWPHYYPNDYIEIPD